jgi:hypothetical protein
MSVPRRAALVAEPHELVGDGPGRALTLRRGIPTGHYRAEGSTRLLRSRSRTCSRTSRMRSPRTRTSSGVRAQLYGSLINLYRALGGGWVDKADELSPRPTAAAAPSRNPDPPPTSRAD